MPTQYPTLSQSEQTARWTDMAKQNLYPYTYQWFGSVDTSTFTRTGANSFQYITIPFQADNNSAVDILEVDSGIVPLREFNSTSDHRTIFVVQISYAPDLNLATPTLTNSIVPITPTDSGNIIYNVFDSMEAAGNPAVPPPFFVLTGDPFNFHHFHRFEPYNYLLKFNQILYIHIGFLNDAHTTSGFGTLNVNCVLHMLNTGLKT